MAKDNLVHLSLKLLATPLAEDHGVFLMQDEYLKQTECVFQPATTVRGQHQRLGLQIGARPRQLWRLDSIKAVAREDRPGNVSQFPPKYLAKIGTKVYFWIEFVVTRCILFPVLSHS